MKDRPHDEAMAKRFYVNPTYAAELRRNSDPVEIAILLRQLTKVVRQDNGGSPSDAEHALPLS